MEACKNIVMRGGSVFNTDGIRILMKFTHLTHAWTVYASKTNNSNVSADGRLITAQ
jgi:hypothetical protein